MIIHDKFAGGNILHERTEGNTVYLKNQLRDTPKDWFYWAFCAEGFAGREITFCFEQANRIGWWGPAVSYDLVNWHWLNQADGESFTYKFADDENKVYFAHNMLYHPNRFEKLAKELSLPVTEFCTSRKGRSVPCVKMGNGTKSVIFTARHHACEATGSYVMEGIFKELCNSPIEDTSVLFVPFVDYDGAFDGDQGKGRAPHDHNRDYDDISIYPETTAIKAYAEENGCNFGFDLHSPWHKGDEHDFVFLVRNSAEKIARFDRLSSLFEAEITPESMKYSGKNDIPPDTLWNIPSKNFARTMMKRPECDIALTLETTYFGKEDNKTSQAKLIELGRCYARAIRRYITEN
ncbi:MAG: hypothetical protein IJC74_03610 [Clostridia bacterium]|nr:hypothetical protein [Clostridia bacterium]